MAGSPGVSAGIMQYIHRERICTDGSPTCLMVDHQLSVKTAVLLFWGWAPFCGKTDVFLASVNVGGSVALTPGRIAKHVVRESIILPFLALKYLEHHLV